jgi:hypothetical protein
LGIIVKEVCQIFLARSRNVEMSARIQNERMASSYLWPPTRPPHVCLVIAFSPFTGGAKRSHRRVA